MSILCEVWRRVRNFFWGPTTGFDGFERRDRNVRKERLICIIPLPSVLRWYEHEGLHFSRLGIVEVDWLWWTAGLYWIDDDDTNRRGG